MRARVPAYSPRVVTRALDLTTPRRNLGTRFREDPAKGYSRKFTGDALIVFGLGILGPEGDE